MGFTPNLHADQHRRSFLEFISQKSTKTPTKWPITRLRLLPPSRRSRRRPRLRSSRSRRRQRLRSSRSRRRPPTARPKRPRLRRPTERPRRKRRKRPTERKRRRRLTVKRRRKRKRKRKLTARRRKPPRGKQRRPPKRNLSRRKRKLPRSRRPSSLLSPPTRLRLPRPSKSLPSDSLLYTKSISISFRIHSTVKTKFLLSNCPILATTTYRRPQNA